MTAPCPPNHARLSAKRRKTLKLMLEMAQISGGQEAIDAVEKVRREAAGNTRILRACDRALERIRGRAGIGEGTHHARHMPARYVQEPDA